MKETDLKLTKEQMQSVINSYLNEENSLNDLFSMLVNGLMYSERKEFLGQYGPGNKGNGYRTVQRAGIGTGLSLSVPRDRLGVFKPVILGILDKQEEQIKELCFTLYGKGLTTRQIGSVIDDIYGQHYSKSSISRITDEFSDIIMSWLNKTLSSHYLVVFIDAIHQPVRRDVVSTEAFYVILGLKPDYTREVLAIVNLPQESASGWLDVLNDIKSRGVSQVDLFVFDDLTGLDNAISIVFNSKRQKCMLHFQRNLGKYLRVNDRKQFFEQLKPIVNPDNISMSKHAATEKFRIFADQWGEKYAYFKRLSKKQDLELHFTYFDYDYRIRRMIYTTNWIERLNKSFRRTTKIRNALPSPKSALILLGYCAMEMEQNIYKYPIMNFKFENNFCKIES
jgi:transposase-like protein